MARLRAAASSAQVQAKPSKDNPARTTRAALKEKTNTVKGPVHLGERNGKEIIQHVGPRRGGVAKKASGRGERVVASARGKSGAQEVTGSQTAPFKVADNIAHTEEASRSVRIPNRAVQGDAQTVVKASTTPRTKTANRRGRALESSRTEEVMERSEFSISPSPPASTKKTSGRAQALRSSIGHPGSALKFHSTPAAAESSIMALKNFKRRPRQPSMLAMVQQYHQSQKARESAGGATVLGAESEVEDPSAYDIDAALEIDGEEEDFSPEAEGTPAHLKKNSASSTGLQMPLRSPKTSRTVTASETNQKRQSTAMDDSQRREDSMNAKRRKIDRFGTREDYVSRSRSESLAEPEYTAEVQVINSSPERYTTESAFTRLSGELDLAGIPTELHVDSLVPSTGLTGTDKQPNFALTRFLDEGDDDVVNGTMADPVSSSPIALQPPEDAIMAYPMTQVTQVPAPLERRKKVKEKKAKPLDTAALQNLLPKKRERLKPRRRKSEYDFIEVSDEEVSDHEHQLEDEDEDELNAPSRRRTKAVSSTKQSKDLAKGRQSKPSAQPRNMKVVASRNSAAQKAKKVYGKAVAANNQENNDESWNGSSEEGEAEESILPDISMSSIEAMKSRELQEAAKKFAEIDDWEGMEFESDNEHRSSSQGWR